MGKVDQNGFKALLILAWLVSVLSCMTMRAAGFCLIVDDTYAEDLFYKLLYLEALIRVLQECLYQNKSNTSAKQKAFVGLAVASTAVLCLIWACMLT